ncbi:hypothetical protein SUGI_0699750 [Cryptomeria japonica]|nr:hypothetical protein SUGI_0699750 [Cryptomeria japonica]
MALRGNDVHAAPVNEEGEAQRDAAAESWRIQIEREMRETWKVSRKVSIYRVLKCMRICIPTAYDPLVISFGPYRHRIDHELHTMDLYKVGAVRRMLARSKSNETSLTKKIEILDSRIRECY